MKRFLTVLLVVGLLLAAGASGYAEEEKKVVGNQVGNYLFEFSLENAIDGKKVSLADLKKKGTDSVLLFMQSACSLCKAEILDFSKESPGLEGKVNVVLVSVDIDKGRLPGYAKSYNISFPILHDPDAAFLEKVGFQSTPSILVFDKSGKILEKKVGYDMAESKSRVKKYLMQ